MPKAVQVSRPQPKPQRMQGQHFQGDGTAVRELVGLDQAQHQGQGDHQAGLCQHSGQFFGCNHCHFLPKSKIPQYIRTGVVRPERRRRQDLTSSTSYAGITRIRFEGPEAAPPLHLSREQDSQRPCVFLRYGSPSFYLPGDDLSRGPPGSAKTAAHPGGRRKSP